MRTIGRRALTASKEIAVSAWYVQMLIKYSIQLWIFLLRSPDFGIVAGLAILVLLCASLPYMSICARIVVAVTLHEVDSPPNAKTCAKRDNQSLQYTNCAVKEIHINLAFLPLCGSKNVVENENAAVIPRRLRPRRTNLFRICQRLHRALLLPGG